MSPGFMGTVMDWGIELRSSRTVPTEHGAPTVPAGGGGSGGNGRAWRAAAVGECCVRSSGDDWLRVGGGLSWGWRAIF